MYTDNLLVDTVLFSTSSSVINQLFSTIIIISTSRLKIGVQV